MAGMAKKTCGHIGVRFAVISLLLAVAISTTQNEGPISPCGEVCDGECRLVLPCENCHTANITCVDTNILETLYKNTSFNDEFCGEWGVALQSEHTSNGTGLLRPITCGNNTSCPQLSVCSLRVEDGQSYCCAVIEDTDTPSFDATVNGSTTASPVSNVRSQENPVGQEVGQNNEFSMGRAPPDLICDPVCSDDTECRFVSYCRQCLVPRLECVPSAEVDALFSKNRFDEYFCGTQGVVVYPNVNDETELLPVPCQSSDDCPLYSTCLRSFTDGQGYCCSHVPDDAFTNETVGGSVASSENFNAINSADSINNQTQDTNSKSVTHQPPNNVTDFDFSNVTYELVIDTFTTTPSSIEAIELESDKAPGRRKRSTENSMLGFDVPLTKPSDAQGKGNLTDPVIKNPENVNHNITIIDKHGPDNATTVKSTTGGHIGKGNTTFSIGELLGLIVSEVEEVVDIVEKNIAESAINVTEKTNNTLQPTDNMENKMVIPDASPSLSNGLQTSSNLTVPHGQKAINLPLKPTGHFEYTTTNDMKSVPSTVSTPSGEEPNHTYTTMNPSISTDGTSSSSTKNNKFASGSTENTLSSTVESTVYSTESSKSTISTGSTGTEVSSTMFSTGSTESTLSSTMFPTGSTEYLSSSTMESTMFSTGSTGSTEYSTGYTGSTEYSTGYTGSTEYSTGYTESTEYPTGYTESTEYTPGSTESTIQSTIYSTGSTEGTYPDTTYSPSSTESTPLNTGTEQTGSTVVSTDGSTSPETGSTVSNTLESTTYTTPSTGMPVTHTEETTGFEPEETQTTVPYTMDTRQEKWEPKQINSTTFPESGISTDAASNVNKTDGKSTSDVSQKVVNAEEFLAEVAMLEKNIQAETSSKESSPQYDVPPFFGEIHSRKKRSSRYFNTVKKVKPVCESVVLHSTKEEWNTHTFTPKPPKLTQGKSKLFIKEVILLKDYSSVPCVERRNFFYMGNTLLASEGCSGLFLVCFGSDKKAVDTLQLEKLTTAPPKAPTTTSTDALQTTTRKEEVPCRNVVMRSTQFTSTRVSFAPGTPIVRSMTLMRKLGDQPCTYQQSYEFSENEATVHQGCSGEFRLCLNGVPTGMTMETKVLLALTTAAETPIPLTTREETISHVPFTTEDGTVSPVPFTTQESLKHETKKASREEACRPLVLKGPGGDLLNTKTIRDKKGHPATVTSMLLIREYSSKRCRKWDTYFYQDSTAAVAGRCWAKFRVCYHGNQPTTPVRKTTTAAATTPVALTTTLPKESTLPISGFTTDGSYKDCTIIPTEADKDGSFQVSNLHLENRPIATIKVIHKEAFKDCPTSQVWEPESKHAKHQPHKHPCVMIAVEVCYTMTTPREGPSTTTTNSVTSTSTSTTTTTEARYTTTPTATTTTTTTPTAGKTTTEGETTTTKTTSTPLARTTAAKTTMRAATSNSTTPEVLVSTINNVPTTTTPIDSITCKGINLSSSASFPDVRVIFDDKHKLVDIVRFMNVEDPSRLCRPGRTYEYHGSAVTAKRGCKGRFLVCYRPRGPQTGPVTTASMTTIDTNIQDTTQEISLNATTPGSTPQEVTPGLNTTSKTVTAATVRATNATLVLTSTTEEPMISNVSNSTTATPGSTGEHKTDENTATTIQLAPINVTESAPITTRNVAESIQNTTNDNSYSTTTTTMETTNLPTTTSTPETATTSKSFMSSMMEMISSVAETIESMVIGSTETENDTPNNKTESSQTNATQSTPNTTVIDLTTNVTVATEKATTLPPLFNLTDATSLNQTEGSGVLQTTIQTIITTLESAITETPNESNPLENSASGIKNDKRPDPPTETLDESSQINGTDITDERIPTTEIIHKTTPKLKNNAEEYGSKHTTPQPPELTTTPESVDPVDTYGSEKTSPKQKKTTTTPQKPTLVGLVCESKNVPTSDVPIFVVDDVAGVLADIRSLEIVDGTVTEECFDSTNYKFRDSVIITTNNCRGDLIVCYKPAQCEEKVLLSGPGLTPEIYNFEPRSRRTRDGPVTIRKLELRETLGSLPCVKWESYYYVGGDLYVKNGCHGRFYICYVDEAPTNTLV